MSKKADNRFPLRLDDLNRWKIERWYKKEDCRSRNEFVEKTVNFYAAFRTARPKPGPLPACSVWTAETV